MAGRVEIRIVAGPEFTAVANALREIDKRLPGQLRRDIRDSVKPLIRRAQAKVRALPVAGNSGKHTGLRRRVARGVRVRVGVGKDPYLRIITVMSDASQAAIPRGLDDPSRGWTHPTFGHDPTVRERSPVGHWFVETFADGRDEISDGLRHVLDDAAEFVAAHGRV